MNRLASVFVVALGSLLFANTSPAHHAFSAEFDPESPIELAGKVTKVRWINPHAWIYMEAVGEDGIAAEWMIEGGTPNALMRTGSIDARCLWVLRLSCVAIRARTVVVVLPAKQMGAI